MKEFFFKFLCTSWNTRLLTFNVPYNQPPKANSAFHPSGVGKWIPASAGKAKAGMVHSDGGWTRGVQVKLWDTLRTHAIPERLRGAFMMRRYTNPRLPLPLLYTDVFTYCVAVRSGNWEERWNSWQAGLLGDLIPATGITSLPRIVLRPM